MRCLILSVAVASVIATDCSLFAQLQTRSLTNSDVIKMEQASLDRQLILAIIQRMPAHFSVDSESLEQLRKSGISTEVLSAMVRKSSGALQTNSGQPDADGIYSNCPGTIPEVLYRVEANHQWIADAGVTGYSASYVLTVNHDGSVLKVEIGKLTGSIKRGEGVETIDIPAKGKDKLIQRLTEVLAKWRFRPCLVDQQPVLFRVKMSTSSN